MKRVVVVGLGIFGFNIAKDLFENGFEVIAIDKNKEVINRIRDFSTKAILADATDKELLEMIGIQPDDTVIVSFGEDLAASTLLTLHLKEMHVKNIIVKAPNEDHKRILLKVGASEAIILMMFAGRVGPLTLAFSFSRQALAKSLTYAEEGVMVG